MKRLIAKLAQALRQQAAVRTSRHASRRTTKLFAENVTLNAELTAALKAEAAAAERMEKTFTPAT